MEILMKQFFTLTAVSLLAANTAFADASHAKHQDGAILSAADDQKVASLDILAAHAHRDGNKVTFHMTTNGVAGADPAKPVGALAGAPATAYVWPTSLDPASVGFEGAPVFWHWPRQPTLILTIHRCLTKTRMAMSATMGGIGTPIGWF